MLVVFVSGEKIPEGKLESRTASLMFLYGMEGTVRYLFLPAHNHRLYLIMATDTYSDFKLERLLKAPSWMVASLAFLVKTLPARQGVGQSMQAAK